MILKHFTLLLFLGSSITCFSAETVYDAVVALDKSGDYTSVQEAIDRAPSNATRPYRILVKEGFYREHVEMNKPNISLIGIDPQKVVIADETFSGGPDRIINGKRIRSGTAFVITADDFYAENITFENSWGVERKAGPQALAMSSNGDRMILKNCRLRSYQDTYLTTTRKHTDRHYLKNCYIEGAVDFIYGSGNVVFDSCTIAINRKSGGYIVAPCHNPVVPWGYVFLNCRIIPLQDSTDVWLGRPWHRSPKTVFINTKTEVTIRPTGWVDKMGGLPVIFAEYNTMDARGKAVDLTQRRTSYWNWKDTSKTEKVTAEAVSVLTKEEAACYTVANVLSGNDAWKSDQICASLPSPTVRRTEKDLRWSKTAGAIGYVILINGNYVAACKQTKLKWVTKATDNIVVRAVHSKGGF